LNLFYSGAHTAREMVAKGAYAALGFLDEIDDELCELFFQASIGRGAGRKRITPPHHSEAFQAAGRKCGAVIVCTVRHRDLDGAKHIRSGAYAAVAKNIRAKATVKTKKLEVEKQRERRPCSSGKAQEIPRSTS
jgi:hypothetical protein